MNHPLEFVPDGYRRRFFFICLSLTFMLFCVFRVLDKPLRTPASPDGIVSFEFARTSQRAQLMIDAWTGRVTVSIFTDGEQSNARIVPAGESFVYNPVPMINAAFGLGLDYVFMPAYALALAFGTLLAAQKHGGLVRTLGAVAGYGAFAAMLSDALENFALLQVLLGAYTSGYPAMAAFCASIKFGFLLFGILVGLFAWLWPKKPRS